MSFFESQFVVMERVEMLLPDVLEKLVSQNVLGYLVQERETLDRITKRVDKYCCTNFKGNDLLEYAGIAKTIVKNMSDIDNAIMAIEEGRAFHVPTVAAAVSLVGSRLYGMNRQIDIIG